MGQSRFERDTAVVSLGDGRYWGEVDPGWAVIAGAAPNGGYLLAMAARAMRDPLPHADPVTITAHFLAPPQPGEVDIEVEVVRSGRRHSTVQARMLQDGRETLRALGTFGNLDAADGPTRIDRQPPPLPRLEECLDATTAGIDQACRWVRGAPDPAALRPPDGAGRAGLERRVATRSRRDGRLVAVGRSSPDGPDAGGDLVALSRQFALASR